MRKNENKSTSKLLSSELHATVPDYKFPHRRQKFMTFIMAWICDRYHTLEWISSLPPLSLMESLSIKIL